MRKAQVTICEKENGTILFLYKSHPLDEKGIEHQPKQAMVVASKSLNQAFRQLVSPQ
jgi:hypothetical protein